jgi:hypothetical protein
MLKIQNFSKRSMFHGSLTLMMIFVALIIGSYSIYLYSSFWGWIYLGIVVIGTIVIVNLFCTKCPARITGCPHVLPGFLTRLFPQRENKPYTRSELIGTMLPIILWILIPQFWIWRYPLLGILFCIFLIIPVIQIRIILCPECSNNCCPVKFAV